MGDDDVLNVLREAIDVVGKIFHQQRVVFRINQAKCPVGGVGNPLLIFAEIRTYRASIGVAWKSGLGWKRIPTCPDGLFWMTKEWQSGRSSAAIDACLPIRHVD